MVVRVSKDRIAYWIAVPYLKCASSITMLNICNRTIYPAVTRATISNNDLAHERANLSLIYIFRSTRRNATADGSRKEGRGGAAAKEVRGDPECNGEKLFGHGTAGLVISRWYG